MCPFLLEKQQSQLQINIVVEDEAADEGNEDEKEKGDFMGIQVAMLQVKELPINRAYLDNCSTVTAFKTAKYIRNIKTTKKGNAGELQRWEHKNKPKRGVRTIWGMVHAKGHSKHLLHEWDREAASYHLR